MGSSWPLNQQARKRVTVLAEAIYPDYQGEIDLILHDGGNKKYVWNTGVPLEILLVFPCAMIQVNGILLVQAGLLMAQTLQE